MNLPASHPHLEVLATSLAVAQGTCYVFLAYDIGLAIDLAACEQHLTLATERATLAHKRRAPQYFAYHPAPLRIVQETEPLCLGEYRSNSTVEAVLYDFGAVSLTYTFPLEGPLARLLALSDALYDNPQLLEDARRRVEQLLALIAPAVVRPAIAEMVEDYTVFHIEAFRTPCPIPALYTTHAQALAQLLRFEHRQLSAQEVRDALACRLSFGLDDLTVIDWNAALLIGRDMDDVRAVLEFANVELLELRFLDDQLDEALDQAYETLSRRSWHRLWLPGASGADLRRIGQLQVDSAMLFEGVNNALKLLGDQYLARVYRLASQRFHLEEWDASILRKLQTLESIYQKLADRAANRRMEILEWIIIVLIAVSILLPLLPGVSW
ncbi:MAG: hypothetical protein KatS3mg131_1430 [Candidatus Tectimicrobiota bacterium]|nr:MAG: hypothetical protein KatS3mg131_1430 [Candidatus Tectomicrobia bacterium]